LQYNSFKAFDTHMASISLSVYALGLPGFVMVKILAPGFFARQDTATPVRFGIIAVLTNLALYAIVVVPWIWLQGPAPHAAFAFCTAFASLVNASLLYRRLRRDGIYQPSKGWTRLGVKIAIALLIMGLGLYPLIPANEVWGDWDFAQRMFNLTKLIGFAALLYLATLWLLRVNPRALLRNA